MTSCERYIIPTYSLPAGKSLFERRHQKAAAIRRKNKTLQTIMSSSSSSSSRLSSLPSTQPTLYPAPIRYSPPPSVRSAGHDSPPPIPQQVLDSELWPPWKDQNLYDEVDFFKHDEVLFSHPDLCQSTGRLIEKLAKSCPPSARTVIMVGWEKDYLDRAYRPDPHDLTGAIDPSVGRLDWTLYVKHPGTLTRKSHIALIGEVKPLMVKPLTVKKALSAVEKASTADDADEDEADEEEGVAAKQALLLVVAVQEGVTADKAADVDQQIRRRANGAAANMISNRHLILIAWIGCWFRPYYWHRPDDDNARVSDDIDPSRSPGTMRPSDHDLTYSTSYVLPGPKPSLWLDVREMHHQKVLQQVVKDATRACDGLPPEYPEMYGEPCETVSMRRASVAEVSTFEDGVQQSNDDGDV